jgi:hypothetical protein
MNLFKSMIDWMKPVLVAVLRDEIMKDHDDYRTARGLGPGPKPPPFPITPDEETVLVAPFPSQALPSIPLPPPAQEPRRRGRPPKVERPVDPATSFETEIEEMVYGKTPLQ